jgi:hypothetical protein
MRIFYILLSIFLLTTNQAKSQAKSPVPDPDIRIVKFYPNPAISYIIFDLEKTSGNSYSLQIFNFLGKKVYESSSINAHTIVSLTDFVRGIYIFQLREPGGRISDSGKFQVNK